MGIEECMKYHVVHLDALLIKNLEVTAGFDCFLKVAVLLLKGALRVSMEAKSEMLINIESPVILWQKF